MQTDPNATLDDIEQMMGTLERLVAAEKRLQQLKSDYDLLVHDYNLLWDAVNNDSYEPVVFDEHDTRDIFKAAREAHAEVFAAEAAA